VLPTARFTRMPRIDSAHREVSASPDEVFDALVDVDARTGWLPPTGMTARFERFDPRPGGGYRLVLTYDDADAVGKAGSNSDVVEVRFADIERPWRVVEETHFISDDPAFGGTMTITWLVEPDAGGSRVTVTASDVPDGISQADHDAGLRSSLANLARWLTT
jgi:uncharacterized protein YndB with AHSA1/START domain